MKRLILLFIISALTWSANAQFVLTPQGFRNDQDFSKDYIICEFDNISKENLYNKMLLYITSTYKSPKTVTSKIENEVISINAIHSDLFKFYLYHTYDLNYIITFEFKDNKIRVKILDFSLDNYTISGGRHLDINGIFNKTGKVKNEKAKKNLEDYFNKYIDNIENIIQKKDDNW